MRARALAAVLTACIVSAIPVAAGASTLTPEEQERDREIIRNLNLRELAYVRQRDAAQARQQQDGRDARQDYESAYGDYVQQRADYLRRRNRYQDSMDSYTRQRRAYEDQG